MFITSKAYLYRSKQIGHVSSCSIFSKGFSNSGGRTAGGTRSICRIRSNDVTLFVVGGEPFGDEAIMAGLEKGDGRGAGGGSLLLAVS